MPFGRVHSLPYGIMICNFKNYLHIELIFVIQYTR